MKSIYKQILFYDVKEITDYKEFQIQGFIKPLKVEMQKETICLWYEFDEEKKKLFTLFRIRVAGTGHSIQDEEYRNLEYLNTLKFYDDSLVFHFYYFK
jgi:hypothetical protein